ncbi:hypothetical protein [Methylopila sp. M107]|uniref:hypothetical protein n=1 Tax=Methylopila sp. M107 TaxID=1101190 RepID=UPI00036E1CF9|nr:hypothetical protein [Methylopila sp. M107]
MLFRRAILEGIAAGEINLAFRRWAKPAVRPGARLRTAIGVVAIDDVETVGGEGPTDDEAKRAGFGSRGELLADLRREPDRALYRISPRFAGPDPRTTLRAAVAEGADLGKILASLSRFDEARGAPWTRATLDLIANSPGRTAAELARALGRETAPFKSDVRKLKELGLTESLPVGYRVSPRGRSVLAALDEA